jgi:hypothetical protein
MPTPTTPTVIATDAQPFDALAQTDDVEEAPHPQDGDHNQGGARPAGLEYQRELGTEQDA